MNRIPKGLEYPKPSISGGATRTASQVRPVERLSDDQLQRISELAKRERAKDPLPPGVAVELVLRR